MRSACERDRVDRKVLRERNAEMAEVNAREEERAGLQALADAHAQSLAEAEESKKTEEDEAERERAEVRRRERARREAEEDSVEESD